MSWSPERLLPAVVVALTIGVAAPAFAHHRDGHICGGSAGIQGGTGSADAACGATGGGAGGAGGPECDPDSSEVASYGPPPLGLADYYRHVIETTPPPDGYTLLAALNCAGGYLGGPHLVADPTWDDTLAARDRARAALSPVFPDPHVSPSRAVVHEPTWLWVDAPSWTTSTETATQGAVTVTVTAEPVSVRWDLDEGERVCDGPGRPWSSDAQAEYEAAPAASRDGGSPACTFTFVHSSTAMDGGVHHASVTVTWRFSWWVNGVPRGVFGTLDRTTDFGVTVGEVQALITDY